MERHGGGKVLDFALPLSAYQLDVADGLVLTKVCVDPALRSEEARRLPGRLGMF